MLVSASVHEHMHADEFRKGVDLRLNGVSSTLKFRIQIKVMSSLLLVLAANHLQTIQYVRPDAPHLISFGDMEVFLRSTQDNSPLATILLRLHSIDDAPYLSSMSFTAFVHPQVRCSLAAIKG